METMLRPAEIAESLLELDSAPDELTSAPLRRIGEGIGQVVYASENWVVKRERTPSEVLALVVLWRALRKLERRLPGFLGKPLLEAPSRQLRLLRLIIQALMLVIPRSVWMTQRIRSVWKLYHRRSVRGARLADEYLAGTALIPGRVGFPPTRVQVLGWPGYLVVSKAEERAECTLYAKLKELAEQDRFAEIEVWLGRFLELRQSGWQRGLFSVDAHLKNFGVKRDKIMLLDTGGLTDRWKEVSERLAFEQTVDRPHVQLGLGSVLASRPDLAEQFDARWKATVNTKVVGDHWPS